MSTPIGDAAAAAAIPPPQPGARLSPLGLLHRDLAHIGGAVEHAWPIIRAIAASPLVDELIDAALTADGLGVEASAFQAAIDALRGASARKAGRQSAQPQPQFLPAPEAHPTGGQVTAPDGTTWGTPEQPRHAEDPEAM